MSLSIEIQKKVKTAEQIQITEPNDVFQLKEVQEIKDAIQEHLLFLGLDNRNNIRNISLIGIGTSSEISIDTKYIIRTALVTASEKVILVHNHPSNKLNPSYHDKHISNITNKLLNVYNIKFVDHIIVGGDDYLSMGQIKAIDRNYEDDKTKLIDNAILIEENLNLKEKIKSLNKKLQKYEKILQEKEEEFDNLSI